MIYFTTRPTSGGNHGHQIKDAIGGLTLGRLFHLEEVHTPHHYLKFLGLGHGVAKADSLEADIPYFALRGPEWNGMTYEAAVDLLQPYQAEFQGSGQPCLLAFEQALRVFPHQAVKWFDEGLVENDVVSPLLSDLSNRYWSVNAHRPTSSVPGCLTVAVHINRGVDLDRQRKLDYDPDESMVRFVFPTEYYQRLIAELRDCLSDENHRAWFHIYTEQLNSEECVSAFADEADVEVFVGPNRNQPDQGYIHQVFHAFVSADILVAGNSSFSSTACYFRSSRATLFSPHAHLERLPTPNFVPIDRDGAFDTDAITSAIRIPPEMT